MLNPLPDSLCSVSGVKSIFEKEMLQQCQLYRLLRQSERKITWPRAVRELEEPIAGELDGQTWTDCSINIYLTFFTAVSEQA